MANLLSPGWSLPQRSWRSIRACYGWVIATGVPFVKEGPTGADQQRSSVLPATHKPRASRPSLFLYFREFSRLSLHVSPIVIWFILEHIGNLTYPFVGQVQRWRSLTLGTRRMPTDRRTRPQPPSCPSLAHSGCFHR